MVIEKKTLENGYKFYDKNGEKLNIVSCIDCEVCLEWKSMPWKTSVFCPVHCHFCHYAGYDDEFDFFPPNRDYKNELSFFVCLKCFFELNKKIKIKNIINRSVYGKFI